MNRSLGLGVLLVILVGATPQARAVCRVLGPTEESGEHEVVFDSVTQALYVVAPDQLVGMRCRALDPGVSVQGHVDPGASVAGYDYPISVETGAPVDPGLTYDAPHELPLELPSTVGVIANGATLGFAEGGHRRLIDAGVLEPPARLCRDGAPADPVYGTLVHTVVQPALYAMGGRGGLVMPLPARADVHVAPSDIFAAAARSVQAHVTETVTYQEDGSLGFQCSDPHYSSNVVDTVLGMPMMLMGCSAGMGEPSAFYDPGLEGRATETEDTPSGSVSVDRIDTTDDYEVVVLNAENLDALTEWLTANEFSWNEEDEAAFSSYVKRGAWFLAIRIDAPELPGNDRVALAPLVVTWRGDEIPVMNRLQYSAVGGVVETDAFVMSPTRMVVEDGSGEVDIAAPAVFQDPAVSVFGLSQGWVTRIHMSRRVDEVKEDSRLVATEGEEIDPLTIERRRTVRIAQACCDGNSYPYGGERSFEQTYQYLDGEPSPAPEYFTAPRYSASECQARSDYSSSPTYYACSIPTPTAGSARPPSRITLALSWLPFIAIFLTLRRRGRRR